MLFRSQPVSPTRRRGWLLSQERQSTCSLTLQTPRGSAAADRQRGASVSLGAVGLQTDRTGQTADCRRSPERSLGFGSKAGRREAQAAAGMPTNRSREIWCDTRAAVRAASRRWQHRGAVDGSGRAEAWRQRQADATSVSVSTLEGNQAQEGEGAWSSATMRRATDPTVEQSLEVEGRRREITPCV